MTSAGTWASPGSGHLPLAHRFSQ